MRAYGALLAICGLLTATLLATSPSRTSSSPDAPNGSVAGNDAFAYILQHPFDAAGYTALAATVASTPEGMAQRRSVLAAAMRLAPTDPAVLYLAASVSAEEGRIDEALGTWRRLVDVSPGDRERVFVAFDRLSNAPAWNAFVQHSAEARWLPLATYAEHVCGLSDNAATERAMALQAVISRHALATPSLQRCIERRLIALGQIDRAYAQRIVFSASLPARIDHVFNGDFERDPDGSAFDWTLSVGGEFRDGFVVAIRAEPDNDNSTRSLNARFTGRPIRGYLAEQTLSLPTGSYSFRYRARAIGFADSPPPRWALRCTGGSASLFAATPATATASGTWTNYAYDFSVPAGCNGQILRLEPASRLSALEGLRGAISIDDVTVVHRE